MLVINNYNKTQYTIDVIHFIKNVSYKWTTVYGFWIRTIMMNKRNVNSTWLI